MNFRIYLKELKLKWIIFYYFNIIFVLGALISAFLIKQSVFPFYIYGMYSFRAPNGAVMDNITIEINNKELNTFSFLKGKGDLIRSNIDRYKFLRSNNYKDKYYDELNPTVGRVLPHKYYNEIFSYENLDYEFMIWLKLFLENETKFKIKQLSIYSQNFVVKNFKPTQKNKVLIFSKSFND